MKGRAMDGQRPGPSERVARTLSSPVVSGIARFNRWRLPPRAAPHPLLTDVHQPMTEELTLESLVVGLIEADRQGTALEIIDARLIERPPLATIRLPHRVPPGIHGAWLPA